MSKVRVHITVSADGYVAGPNQSLENPLGEGGGSTTGPSRSEPSASPTAWRAAR
jgi:hypothetical protein